jgi:acetyl esterase/lipase
LRRFWWTAAGVLAAAGIVSYLRNKALVDFYVQLLGAQRIARQFYLRYPLITKNIAYGPGPAQKLDVYRPESGSGYPVFVYVHGGSWNSGNKELYAPIGERLLPFGMVVITVGYTLYPYARYRQQTRDVAAAVAWVLENAGQYGGDPKKVIVCSQSAGAHLAGLALFDERWLGETGHHVSEIAGFIGISGVYDIEAEAEYGRAVGMTGDFLARVMEGEANFQNASPVTYVRPGLPRVLLIHGDADTTVPIEIAEVFHDALLATGNDSRFLVYGEGGHAEILFKALDRRQSKLINDMVYFVRTCRPVA